MQRPNKFMNGNGRILRPDQVQIPINVQPTGLADSVAAVVNLPGPMGGQPAIQLFPGMSKLEAGALQIAAAIEPHTPPESIPALAVTLTEAVLAECARRQQAAQEAAQAAQQKPAE